MGENANLRLVERPKCPKLPKKKKDSKCYKKKICRFTKNKKYPPDDLPLRFYPYKPYLINIYYLTIL